MMAGCTPRHLLATILVLILVPIHVCCYDNQYKQSLNKTCEAGSYINKIRSIHADFSQDRQWEFSCRKEEQSDVIKDTEVCTWHRGINKFDGKLDHKCPAGSVVSGVASVFSSKRRDRVWDLKCCKYHESCTFLNVRKSGCLNRWDRPISWHTDKHMVGVYSYHSNLWEDRRWKVYTADLKCECLCIGEIEGTQWTLTDIDYDLDDAAILNSKDIVLSRQTFENSDSSAEISGTFTVRRELTESFHFSHTTGVTVTKGFSIEASIPGLVAASSSLELSISMEFEWGKEMTMTRGVEASYTVTVPPMASVKASAVITQATVNVPYKATFRHKTRGCLCASEGVWTGVQQYNLHAMVENITPGASHKEPIMVMPDQVEETPMVMKNP